MKLMVVGGGGREHAIIKKLKENPEVTEIFALPGNGGIAADATCVPIGAKEIDKIVEFAVAQKIDFAVVGPDDPLVMGAVDRLHEAGIPCFGPEAKAAIIEGSKVFAKNLMKKYAIPTAVYAVFDAPEKALEYLASAEYPTVIKADGLALGKGVIIAQNRAEAENAVRLIMEDKIFGASGNQIVIEEFLTGPEVSVLAFTDGESIVPMVSLMDHKRALDHDEGLNTGGMGTIAPNPCYTTPIAWCCVEQIMIPTVRAMRAEGRTFRGCLYFGLMLTPKGPKVIEYNCRFGDPETQIVLPLLKTDLLTIMRAVEEGRLGEINVEFEEGAACCVVVASKGYPGKYATGCPIAIDEAKLGDAVIYHAGTKLVDGQLVTSGGRVLGVTAKGPDLERAIQAAYAAVDAVSFAGAYHRNDIGERALREVQNLNN